MQKCILIYEDDLEILHLCKTILTHPDRRIETMTHCENIISDIKQFNPNVILMDLWIPEIGGEKAITLMKNQPGTSDIPVILFSANDGIEDICEKVNADGYLKKPFDIAALKTIIENNIT